MAIPADVQNSNPDHDGDTISPPLTGSPYGDNPAREGLLITDQAAHLAFAQNTRNEVRLQGGSGDICGALNAQEGMKQRTYVASFSPMAFTERGRKEGRTLELQPDIAYALTNPGSGGRTHSRQILDSACAVRRLTPVECERLQGFPDDYTLVPYKRPFANLPAALVGRSYKRYLRRMRRNGKEPLPLDELIKCADGPRYKALGNSMAVPCMRWIGERILKEYRREQS